MSKRILVTGGLGFIGFHLCKRLIELWPDTALTVVDNLSGTRLDYSILRDFAEVHIEDLCRFQSPAEPFDEIYHLASPVGSLGILSGNGHVARNILELAESAVRLAGDSGTRVLYVSSSEVYGRDGRHDESSEQVVPQKHGTRMEYALGKLTAEHVFHNLAAQGTFELRIVRPFNAVGELQCSDIGFVMPRFFEAAFAGRPLLVHGDGAQCRSFCHVADLVDGIIAAQTRGAHGATYNVGNPDNIISIEQLAQAVVARCNSRSAIEYVNPAELYGPLYVEAFNKIPNIDRVTADTGWQPGINLDGVLDRMYQHYAKAHNPAPDCRLAPGEPAPLRTSSDAVEYV